MRKEIEIKGMMCEHCRMHVENALKELDGVISIEVSLEKGIAILTSNKNIDDPAIKKMVAEAGYKVIEIKQL